MNDDRTVQWAGAHPRGVSHRRRPKLGPERDRSGATNADAFNMTDGHRDGGVCRGADTYEPGPGESSGVPRAHAGAPRVGWRRFCLEDAASRDTLPVHGDEDQGMRVSRLGLVGVALAALLHAPAQARDAGADSERGLDLFGRVFETIHDNYVHGVTRDALARAAIDGMLATLDPHSAYLPEPDYEAREALLSGRFAGIGLDLQDRRGVVTVVAPVAGSPAAAAGLQPGDRLVSVDGRKVADLLLEDVVARIKGAPGTRVRLAVETASHAIRTLTLTRVMVHAPVVQASRFGTRAYIRLTSFDSEAGAAVAAAWSALAREAAGPPSGLVLDLRGNPGGEVDQAVAVANLFIRHGAIVAIRGRTAADDARFDAHGPDITNGAPIVVLADASTASASEIVAGALQDHARAAILGTRSFGKGSVQEMLPLDGRGALVLTTALYFTPNGRSIQGLGIVPDVIVHEARDEPDEAHSTEASLPHAIEPVDATDVPRVSPWRALAGAIASRPPTTWPEFDATRPATDFQLQQALKLLGLMSATVTAQR